MRDLNSIQGTFASLVSQNGPRLKQIQNSRTALLTFFEEGLNQAKQNKHLSEVEYKRFAIAAQTKRSAKDILQLIYNMSLSGAKMAVLK